MMRFQVLFVHVREEVSSHSIQELIWLYLIALWFNSFVSFIFFSKWQKHLPLKTLEDLIKAGNIWSPFLSILFNILFWSGLRSAVLWGHFAPSDPFTGCHSDRFCQAKGRTLTLVSHGRGTWQDEWSHSSCQIVPYAFLWERRDFKVFHWSWSWRWGFRTTYFLLPVCL